MERYSKVKNVGKGNMGQCIQVRRNEDGKIFVMKLIDLSKMNKKERTASLNEAKVLSCLSHPNVIHYIDSFLSRKTEHLCIVMEWAEGGDLSNRIKHQRGKPFSEEQILDWFIQICLGLQSCHQKKVLHRDIKTQNIFLSGSGVIKVGDFGISRILQNTFDCAHTFVGTPYYLSPELVQERPYNTASDIWALGVVLYELMALRHPFNATDMKGLMYKIMRVMYDPPPALYSNELRAVVPKLLQKEPSKRLKIGQILELPIIQRRLRALCEGVADSSVPPSYIQSLVQMGIVADPNAKYSDDDSDESDEEDDLRSQPPKPVAPPRQQHQQHRDRHGPRELAPIDPRKLKAQHQPEPVQRNQDFLPPLKGLHYPSPDKKPGAGGGRYMEPPKNLGPLAPLRTPSNLAPPPPISGIKADNGRVPAPPPPHRNFLGADPLNQPRQRPSYLGSDISSNPSRMSHQSQYSEARRQAELNRLRANSKYHNILNPQAQAQNVQHVRGWRF